MSAFTELKAGSELDALVAIEVMGAPRPTSNVPEDVFAGLRSVTDDSGSWIGTTTGFNSGDEPLWVPKPYSQDIAAAWEVVEKMREEGGTAWEEFYEDVMHTWYGTDGHRRALLNLSEDRAAERICIAAVKARGHKPDA